MLYPTVYQLFFAGVSTDMSNSLSDASNTTMAQDGLEYVEQEMTHMEGRSVGMLMAVAGGMALRKGLTSLSRSLSGRSAAGDDGHAGGWDINGRRRKPPARGHALSSVMELRPQRSTRSRRRTEGVRIGVAAPSTSTFFFDSGGEPAIITPWY